MGADAMTDRPAEPEPPGEDLPNSVADEFDFWDDRYEGRRLFSELLGTFFLVLVAVGGGMVNARFGGDAVPPAAQVVAPALMVAAVILFMGTVSGAHLNPVVSVAFALRGDFPWRRVPAYVVAQLVGSVLATLLLWALIGRHGDAGLTLPGAGIPTTTATLWELVLTTGLVSVILGTASGAQQIGPLAAIGVGGYIALAGLWGGAGQRCVDEPGPLPRTGPRAPRLDGVVGLPRRARGRRDRRRRVRVRPAGTRRRPFRTGSGAGHARHGVTTRPHDRSSGEGRSRSRRTRHGNSADQSRRDGCRVRRAGGDGRRRAGRGRPGRAGGGTLRAPLGFRRSRALDAGGPAARPGGGP
ncbi:major intrinsic protein [Pseudonocardia sp. Ae168_Ps1]|nr:major intrinsic protein [Pseudonocardia sp. Ae150A_Ps1]OLL79201.1 major intrinsic protein [Pseudonocardia sp. Ae168_Ps1]OLL86662.1 major intrinsic protein [Pseudonocardia sp. Ae263_Ps1]OLL93292.1 major intrinsic protein [Pseudonocardia sp. Ae356_Ps1]